MTQRPTGSDVPHIFQVLTKKKNGVQDQGDALIRWHIETAGIPHSASWEDPNLKESWIKFVTGGASRKGLCQITGVERILARKHPAKLRNGKDGAKLISSNDKSGYTFRGRFLDADQAITIGSDVTQKAHSALRWLIGRRQAYQNGDQVIVTWAVSGKDIPDPLASSDALFEDPGSESETPVETSGDSDVGQAFAQRLAKLIAGYKATLGPTDDIMIMGLDSATPGRLAVTFYRELKGSEFLERVNAWHMELAWPQRFSWDNEFVGAPSPKDIAQAAFGAKVDAKLLRSTIERLLPCIIDARRVPRDLVESVVRRVAHRIGMSSEKRRGVRYESEWEKSLGIACSLFKGFHNERNYLMALEPNRTTRDYLYGRLFALAEHLEQRALYVAGESRDTTAARNIQRFCDRPYSTWLNIEGKGLPPYQSRLRSKRPGFLHQINSLLDDVHALFERDDYISDAPLTGEWLLGYHCQRSELKNSAVGEDNSSKDSPKERN